MPRTAIALRHVPFEDLGTFESVLTAAGYAVRYHDAGVDDPAALDALRPDPVIVLGGPVGVYETDAYPVLAQERAFLRARLEADRPTFGICLGAQLIAAALGAAVAPTGTPEIGFAPLTLTGAGANSPLRHLRDVPVLHWHGDMFEVPDHAERLAETPACRNQAFRIGTNVMAVQFHPEADAATGFERWLIGHARELADAGIDPRRLRAEAGRHAAGLRDAGRAMFAEWLGSLRP
ncbi:glutamine amidotransferase [Azospirillum halopraeferens]|uniref:glutamine amidotransferase n=1 Tax=Azospirillum halopraeferens TaxID=34010 RepID=UPI000407048C|nr:glutamine amidotransferase [Azospirillum halopraeferens]